MTESYCHLSFSDQSKVKGRRYRGQFGVFHTASNRAVANGYFDEVDGRIFHAKVGFGDVRLRVKTSFQNFVQHGNESYDVGSSITLSCQIEWSSFEAREHFHEVRKEVHLVTLV